MDSVLIGSITTVAGAVLVMIVLFLWDRNRSP
jgi:hypothetical protein